MTYGFIIYKAYDISGRGLSLVGRLATVSLDKEMYLGPAIIHYPGDKILNVEVIGYEYYSKLDFTRGGEIGILVKTDLNKRYIKSGSVLFTGG